MCEQTAKGTEKGGTRKKRCGVKKERGREGLWDEKEVGALKGNGKEMDNENVDASWP